MKTKNLVRGCLYSNMDGVYKYASNGYRGGYPVWCFWLCDYDEEKEKYVETANPVFMTADEVLTLDRA